MLVSLEKEELFEGQTMKIVLRKAGEGSDLMKEVIVLGGGIGGVEAAVQRGEKVEGMIMLRIQG